MLILSPLQSVVDLVLQSNPGTHLTQCTNTGRLRISLVKVQAHSTGHLSSKPSPPPLTSFKLVDPPLRDGFLTLAAAADYIWTVIRYEVPVNTVTFMHCHINKHLFGGMAVVLLEGADTLPRIPDEYLRFQQYGTFWLDDACPRYAVTIRAHCVVLGSWVVCPPWTFCYHACACSSATDWLSVTKPFHGLCWFLSMNTRCANGRYFATRGPPRCGYECPRLKNLRHGWSVLGFTLTRKRKGTVFVPIGCE